MTKTIKEANKTLLLKGMLMVMEPYYSGPKDLAGLYKLIRLEKLNDQDH